MKRGSNTCCMSGCRLPGRRITVIPKYNNKHLHCNLLTALLCLKSRNKDCCPLLNQPMISLKDSRGFNFPKADQSQPDALGDL